MILDSTEKPKPSGEMPSSIWYIIGNEAAERFNYYGLRAILVTFMVAQFYGHLSSEQAEATANAKTHDFVAMSYLLPLFGGMVSDWFWGKYKTILYLSLVYAFGNILLATVGVGNEAVFTSALMLIAMGAGGIKPCVSANVGDQFDKSNEHLLSKAFSYFYAAINAGSLLSILLIPYLKDHFSASVAFGVPAVAMLIATAFFYAGRNQYVRIPPKGDNNKAVILISAFVTLIISYLYWDTIPNMIHEAVKNNQTTVLTNAASTLYPWWYLKYIISAGTGPILFTWAILILIIAFIFKKQWFAKPGNFIGINLYALTNGGFDAAAKQYGSDTIDGIRSVWRVFSVFAFVPFFWALWDQSQSEWVIQAGKTNLDWLGITWAAEQISFVNAGFILLFIPIFTVGMKGFLEGIGIDMNAKKRMGTAVVLTLLAGLFYALSNNMLTLSFLSPSLAAQLTTLVVLLIAIMFIPAFYNGLFPTLEKIGIKVTPLRKIGAGLVLTALSFVVIALMQHHIDFYEAALKVYKDTVANDWKLAHNDEKIKLSVLNAMSQDWIKAHNGISIVWQILAFIILTAGEVLVSITCLEYAYTQAPPSMKSTIMASYLLTVTIGNVIDSVIQNSVRDGGFFAQFHGEGFFWLFTGICAATAVVFMLVSPFIKEKSYVGVGAE